MCQYPNGDQHYTIPVKEDADMTYQHEIPRVCSCFSTEDDLITSPTARFRERIPYPPRPHSVRLRPRKYQLWPNVGPISYREKQGRGNSFVDGGWGVLSSSYRRPRSGYLQPIFARNSIRPDRVHTCMPTTDLELLWNISFRITIDILSTK